MKLADSFFPVAVPTIVSWLQLAVAACSAAVTAHAARTMAEINRRKTSLELQLRNFTSGGWIENPAVAVKDGDEDGLPVAERSRVAACFMKARIVNVGKFTARETILSLTKIERITDAKLITPIETFQPLRWSDTWLFRADADRNMVDTTAATTIFPGIPSNSFRYCDVCFYYDLAGPKVLGRFRKDRVYFCVTNLPSNTYSVVDGEYLVTFHLGSENCASVERAYHMTVNLAVKNPEERVRFRPVEDNKGERYGRRHER